MVIGRVDVFWMGAGGFLTLFGANEIVAYATHPVPRWLGGPLVLAGEIVAVLIGLAVMYGLGIREPLVSPPEEEAAAASSGEGAPPPAGAAGEPPDSVASIDLPPARGSVSHSAWPRSSTNSRQ